MRVWIPLALCGALTACTSGSSSQKATPAPSTVATAPQTLPPQVARQFVTAPGFATSTAADATNAALSSSDFNDFIGKTDIAQTAHLKRAYEATFDSNAGDDSILVVLADFASPSDARTFNNLANHPGPFRDSRGDPAVKPSFGSVPGVPGSVIIDPTVASAESGNDVATYDHAVAMVKGSRVAFIDYITPMKGTVAMLADFAKQQYRRL